MPLHVYNFIKERVPDINKYNIKIGASKVDVSNNKLDNCNVDMAVQDDLVASGGARDDVNVNLIEAGRAMTIVQVDE